MFLSEIQYLSESLKFSSKIKIEGETKKIEKYRNANQSKVKFWKGIEPDSFDLNVLGRTTVLCPRGSCFEYLLNSQSVTDNPKKFLFEFFCKDLQQQEQKQKRSAHQQTYLTEKNSFKAALKKLLFKTLQKLKRFLTRNVPQVVFFYFQLKTRFCEVAILCQMKALL